MTDYVNGVKELENNITFAPMTTGQTSLGVRLEPDLLVQRLPQGSAVSSDSASDGGPAAGDGEMIKPRERGTAA